MERLTERDEFGNADIIGVDSVELQGNLHFNELNRVTNALNRLCEFEDKLESGELRELPNGWLDTLKLLTCAAMCYADIESMIANGMKDNEELANLFFSIPRVQGSVNDIALKQLAESKIDCDKIKSVEEVLNAMPIFKRRFQDN